MAETTNKLANMAKSAGKATGDLFKTTKLNLSLSNEQSALRNLYIDIGKKVHEIYRYGGSLGELFDKMYGEIVASEARTADLKAQIAVIRGIRDCPSCNKSVERTAEFCPKCGTPIRESTHTEEAETEYEPPPAAPYEPQYESKRIQQPMPASNPPLPVPQPMPVPTPSPPTPPPPIPMPASHTPATHTPTATKRTCRICGTSNETTTKFCLSCGRIID